VCAFPTYEPRGPCCADDARHCLNAFLEEVPCVQHPSHQRHCCYRFCWVRLPRLQSMKLLTPEVGWAADQRLFWTANGGGDWKDITPKKPVEGEEIGSIFFLDTSAGWVLLSRYAEPEPRFDLVSTTGAGQSWWTTRTEIPRLDPETAVLGGDGGLTSSILFTGG